MEMFVFILGVLMTTIGKNAVIGKLLQRLREEWDNLYEALRVAELDVAEMNCKCEHLQVDRDMLEKKLQSLMEQSPVNSYVLYVENYNDGRIIPFIKALRTHFPYSLKTAKYITEACQQFVKVPVAISSNTKAVFALEEDLRTMGLNVCVEKVGGEMEYQSGQEPFNQV